MKKLFLIVALALFVFNVNAQDDEKSNKDSSAISLGIVAGVNFSTLTGDDDENLSSLTGIHAGVEADIPLSEKISFQPGLIYSCQGADYEDSEDGGVLYDGKFNLSYLNVPLIIAIEFADGFTFEAGPQLGFLTSAKDEYDDGMGDSGEDDIKDFLKSTDFSASVGLGYRMESGLNIGARYNIGLSNVNDFDGAGDIKNGVFQISIGYFFN